MRCLREESGLLLIKLNMKLDQHMQINSKIV